MFPTGHWETYVSSGFANDFKEQVRANTDIVDLVSSYTTLQPKGHDYVGLCRFHDDHRPSMTVSRERQSFKCWSCGEGGDCFSFVMKAEAIAFPEALELLARRAGLEMPRSSQARRQSDDKSQAYEALRWAETEFHRCLLTAAQAEPVRGYLRDRGVTKDAIAEFRLGYHPDDWHWLQRGALGKFSGAQLAAARLVTERREGEGFVDYFVNRVMFPIRDDRGRTVAFGGRALPGSQQEDRGKYFNSPESPLFSKSKLLYGLDMAKDTVRTSGSAIVVEGYTDCISARQHGINNAVATLGTALTEAHVRNLKRFANRVVLLFDGDTAGRNAAERSISHFLALDVDLRILALPDGLDPADFLEKHGTEALKSAIENAPDAPEYKLRSLIEQHGLATVDARARILNDMLDVVGRAPRLSGTSRENVILGKLAQRLMLDESGVRKQLTDARRRAAASQRPASATSAVPSPAPQADRDALLERDLLTIMLVAPQWTSAIQTAVGPDDFRDARARQIAQICFDLAEQGLPASYDQLMAAIEDPELKRFLVELEHESRDKRVEQLLRQDPTDETANEWPLLLTQAVERWQWRRREQSHELAKGEMAQQSEPMEGWDEQVVAQLRRANEFHQARAGKRT